MPKKRLLDLLALIFWIQNCFGDLKIKEQTCVELQFYNLRKLQIYIHLKLQKSCINVLSISYPQRLTSLPQCCQTFITSKQEQILHKNCASEIFKKNLPSIYIILQIKNLCLQNYKIKKSFIF